MSDKADKGMSFAGPDALAPPGSQPNVTLTVSPDPGLGFVLDTMEAEEELGRPFVIRLDVSAAKPRNDVHAILGSTATVKLSFPEKQPRYFNGIVARVEYRGLSGGGYRYRLELRPWIWLLSHQQDCRIFSALSAWDIIGKVFQGAGFSDFKDSRQNQGGSTVLDFCVQYRETSLDFVTRLMEQFGLYYYVSHSEGSHVVNICDDTNSHPSAGAAVPYGYNQTDWRAGEDHVWDWSADARIQPGATTVMDYNFTTPRADLTAKSLIPGGHTHGTGEVYDYPGLYEVVGTGKTAAEVRMQDFATRRQVYGGTSNSRRLGAGMKFTLKDFPDAAGNQEYLVTHSVCTVERAETRSFQDDEAQVDTFRCVMRAVPGTQPFRLPVVTPRPLVGGPQTARVAGESGQEVTTDQYGRIKVKFPWDRRTAEDENSSCWIRVAQVWAGQGWGAMFIPRIGQEVVVEFLEGNPDRPLVTGAVYNANMTVPYALPDNKTRSTVKTNSSLGGSGFNEFRFEDKKDSEEVFLHAQKDFNEVVLNTHTATITQDTTTTVEKGNRVVTVSKGNDTHTVSAGDYKVDVTAGSLTVTAGTRITLKVGGNSIELSQTGITVKGMQVKASADTTMEVSGLSVKVTGETNLALDGGLSATLKGGAVMIN